MSYSTIENFTAGVDRSRERYAIEAGALWEGINGHITRGGDFEIRKEFVEKYSLPAGTFGVASNGLTLYVFGSGVDPGVPVGVTYQRLQHPDGQAMSKVLDIDLYDGKFYVIAQFADGSIMHFYDGALVADWISGTVRAGMTNNAGIAAHLEALIAADATYSVSRVSNVITIEAAVAGTPFTISTETQNVTGGTDDQTAVVANTVANVAGTAETLATCSFRILGGSTSAGVNKISSVTINGVDALGSAVDYATSNAITAANIATQINSFNSTPEYTASANGDTVTISAATGSGDSPNGFAVSVAADGDVIVTRGKFRITGGTSNPGVNRVTSVTVNGVNILGANVDWTTSHAATAAAVAAQIRAFNSAPEYIAFASGDTVYVGSTTASNGNPSNLTLAVNVGGDVTAAVDEAVSSTVSAMDGGVDAVPGQAQEATVTIGGTFEAGDRFTVILDGKRFGYQGNPSSVGSIVKTHRRKLYSASGSVLNFCGVEMPAGWNSLEDAGAGFINMATHQSGSTQLAGLATYQDKLAVLARNVIQIWVMRDDDDQNEPFQVVTQTGTRAPQSVLEFGELDVFYLSDTGIRSLRARQSVNLAGVQDVGSLIDKLVTAWVGTLSAATVEAAVAVVEPEENRFWLAIGPRIFVFSYFPASKVSAWTWYELSFTPEAFAVVGTRIYARAGNKIYLYGGDSGQVWSTAAPKVSLGFLTFKKDGTFKNLSGIDIAARGTWDCKLLVDPNRDDEAVCVHIGEIDGFSYQGEEGNIGALGHFTHIAPVLVGDGGEYASVSKLTLYYGPGDAKG